MRVRCMFALRAGLFTVGLLTAGLSTSAKADLAPDTTAAGPEIADTDVSISPESLAPLSPSHHAVDAGADSASDVPSVTLQHCERQAAQAFLIRSSWFKRGTREEEKLARDQQLQALDYRTENYGHFPGYSNPRLNAHPPSFYAQSTTFLGLPLQVNKRIVPAVKCVEAALKAAHVDGDYKPTIAGGIRFKNTYKGPEVSNHIFGIAIDIEPHRNTCCNCVAPWPDHPLCKKRVTSIYERMTMPRSWVVIFERYGFYWLGHDVLQDTMHFEFLGDPDKILGAPAGTTAGLSSAVPAASVASAPVPVPVAAQAVRMTYSSSAPFVSNLRRVVDAYRATRH